MKRSPSWPNAPKVSAATGRKSSPAAWQEASYLLWVRWRYTFFDQCCCEWSRLLITCELQGSARCASHWESSGTLIRCRGHRQLPKARWSLGLFLLPARRASVVGKGGGEMCRGVNEFRVLDAEPSEAYG